jgi:stearoyl-CoA desaturase (Delta-9 desaturase)
MNISQGLGSSEDAVHLGFDWTNLLFMLAVHIAAIAGISVYLQYYDLSPHHFMLCLGGFALTSVSISAGYHRLFAHRTYETGTVLQALWLFLGASAFQTSALQWARKHRAHHRHIDTSRDPYNACRGLWYSHLGWVIQRARPIVGDDEDLRANALVRFQHRHYVAIGVVSGFVVPGVIGFALGDIWGGLLFGGVLRLVCAYHATFSVNSLAHWVGSQPYSQDNTARDCWLTALVTMGEGYHNFHHTFPGDYRNGVKRFDFDPPKWLLALLAHLRIVRNLRLTPEHLIALRRLRTDKGRMDAMSMSDERRSRLVVDAAELKQTLGAWARLTSGQQTGEFTEAKRKKFFADYHTWRSELAVADLRR